MPMAAFSVDCRGSPNLRIRSSAPQTNFDNAIVVPHPVHMAPATTTPDLLTVADYRATPEGSRYQLIQGDLIMAPAPNLHHQRIARNLTAILSRVVAANDLGEVLPAPFDVYLSEHDVLQPDLLFVAKAHLGILAEDGAHGAPDLVIEILSASTALLDKRQKRRIYARAGVKELWLVDPLLRQIQRYDLERDPAKPVQLIEEDEAIATPLFPGLTLTAAEIFRR
jgi:Uma2 family endonuclease